MTFLTQFPAPSSTPSLTPYSTPSSTPSPDASQTASQAAFKTAFKRFAPKRFDLIVFDWDGTIINSTGLIAECIQLAAAEVSFKVPTTIEAKHIIGLSLQQSIAALFPGISDDDFKRFAEAFRAHYVPRDDEPPLYDGIPELLESLQHPDRFLAVATGKPRAGLERAFGYTGLKPHFHYTRCADEGFPKPNPDMLFKLMALTGVQPDRVLMIGDTTHDLQLAENAGVAAIGLTYGAHSRQKLMQHSSKAIVDNVAELGAWLHEHA